MNATLVKGTETATFTAREHGGVSLRVMDAKPRGGDRRASDPREDHPRAACELANLKRKGWHENS